MSAVWHAWVQNPEIPKREFSRGSEACAWVVEMVRDPIAHWWGFVRKGENAHVAVYRGETGIWS